MNEQSVANPVEGESMAWTAFWDDACANLRADDYKGLKSLNLCLKGVRCEAFSDIRITGALFRCAIIEWVCMGTPDWLARALVIGFIPGDGCNYVCFNKLTPATSLSEEDILSLLMVSATNNVAGTTAELSVYGIRDLDVLLWRKLINQ